MTSILSITYQSHPIPAACINVMIGPGQGKLDIIIKLSCIEYKFRLVLLAFDIRTNWACKRYTKTTNHFKSFPGELKTFFCPNSDNSQMNTNERFLIYIYIYIYISYIPIQVHVINIELSRYFIYWGEPIKHRSWKYMQ